MFEIRIYYNTFVSALSPTRLIFNELVAVFSPVSSLVDQYRAEQPQTV
jgi:hypothetical protein